MRQKKKPLGQGLGKWQTLSSHVLWHILLAPSSGTSMCISNLKSSPKLSCVVFIEPHYMGMIDWITDYTIELKFQIFSHPWRLGWYDGAPKPNSIGSYMVSHPSKASPYLGTTEGPTMNIKDMPITWEIPKIRSSLWEAKEKASQIIYCVNWPY